ncbi:MAG: hypothetical protein MUF77_04035, partial [Leptospira sp.]|nr:hypothetical protein [Leptospira sp.]
MFSHDQNTFLSVVAETKRLTIGAVSKLIDWLRFLNLQKLPMKMVPLSSRIYVLYLERIPLLSYLNFDASQPIMAIFRVSPQWYWPN